MKASARRLVTLIAAATAALAMIVAMFSAPRLFTGAPQAFHTPASATLEPAPAAQVTDPGGQAPIPDAGILTAKLDAILADAPDGTGFSAQVLDLPTGQVLYEKNGAGPGTPASSLKIATAIAALDTLGAEHRLQTSTLLDGDTLVLRGGGDVLLGDGASDPAATVGHAGIKTLAEQTARELKLRGVQQVKLWLDDSLFAGAQGNAAWDKSLYTSNNIADLYPLAHYAGRASAVKGAAHERDAAQAVRRVFARELSAHLQVTDGGRGAYPGGEVLASVDSAPLGAQIKHMLLVSDNYLTETMGRLVAVELGLEPGQANQAVQQVAERLGAQGMELADASGLAASNKVPPAALTGLLHAASHSPDAGLRELAYWLPVAGYSGTLADRLGTADTRGLIRAKTGSLSGVATLTGVTLTSDGRPVAFSIFAHHPGGGLAPHKPTLDAAVRALHACGCR